MEHIKLITGELCYALLGNINDNIDSVSFNCKSKDEIYIRFILKNLSLLEKELINDTLAEFEALHGSLTDLQWDICLTKDYKKTLSNMVFDCYKEKTCTLTV